ncbi:type II toxin-antitoxin system HicB family antitoxin [Dictyobacter kobayashii]
MQWNEEDQAYIVTVPELPGCKPHGKTYIEDVKQEQDAIESWIKANKAWGCPIPAPTPLWLYHKNSPCDQHQAKGTIFSCFFHFVCSLTMIHTQVPFDSGTFLLTQLLPQREQISTFLQIAHRKRIA